MLALIDADVLVHELGWSGQFKDKETGEDVLLSLERVLTLLDEKIKLICEDVEASEPPILFLTDSEWLHNEMDNRDRIQDFEPRDDFVPNFRYDVAVTQPYKGNRKNPKPTHFWSIVLHMLDNYECVVSEGGLEADDELCITQTYVNGDTVICSRDKDLRICPGNHFSWECGGQRAVGPHFTDRLGSLSVGNNGKTLGYGLKFFYYQMLVGDTADHILGLRSVGDKGALKLLDGLETEWELYSAVKAAYKDKGMGKEYFMEQANLLWMIQERGVGYGPPKRPQD